MNTDRRDTAVVFMDPQNYQIGRKGPSFLQSPGHCRRLARSGGVSPVDSRADSNEGEH
jgi:hypothetical protein